MEYVNCTDLTSIDFTCGCTFEIYSRELTILDGMKERKCTITVDNNSSLLSAMY